MANKQFGEEKNLPSIRMKVEQFLQQANVDLQRAREAQDIGNEGKAPNGCASCCWKRPLSFETAIP